MPRNRLPRVMKNTILQLAEGIMADLCRDFWIRETGTGQRVAQLHDRFMMMTTTYLPPNFIRTHINST